VAIGVPHLSAYQLTIEPNTVFFSKPPALPEHDLSADMAGDDRRDAAAQRFRALRDFGVRQAGHRCRHNLNYWEFGDYLGIGAGAHGKISFPDRITRHSRMKQPREYFAAQDTLAEQKTIPAAELPFEFMLNALRLPGGFSIARFQERTGLPFTVISSPLRIAEEKGLLERDLKQVRPSAKGQRFLNELLELFLR